MNTSSYIYGESFYHKYDIRAKLFFTFLYSILVFFVRSWYGLIAFPLIPFAVFLVSLGGIETWRAIKRILPVIILLFLFLPLQDRGGNPIVGINGFVFVTGEGLYRVCRLASRFIALSLILMLLIETERSENIIRGLRFYRMPYNVALLFSMILRFIPYLGSMFDEIRASMSLRLTEGKRGFPIMPSITAFAVASVRMIPDTAAALEERGFGRKERRDYKGLKTSPKLFTELFLSAILPIIFFIVMR